MARENPANTLHGWRIIFCRGCPHYACGFVSGRLTPCLFKVLGSAIWSPFGRMNPRHSPARCPCPCPVRDRSQSETMSAVCPCPRTVHVRGLSVNMSLPSPSPQVVRDRVQAMSAHLPIPESFRRQFRVATCRRPRDFRPASALATLNGAMHSFVPTQGAGADQPLGGWARESRFDGRSPGGASMSCSPCCPLRSTLTRRPAPEFCTWDFARGELLAPRSTQLWPNGFVLGACRLKFRSPA